MLGFWKRDAKSDAREKIETESVVEREKMERLEMAEAEVAALKARAGNAIRYLDARGSRNCWRESIEQMIQGV